MYSSDSGRPSKTGSPSTDKKYNNISTAVTKSRVSSNWNGPFDIQYMILYTHGVISNIRFSALHWCIIISNQLKKITILAYIKYYANRLYLNFLTKLIFYSDIFWSKVIISNSRETEISSVEHDSISCTRFDFKYGLSCKIILIFV